MSMSDFDFLVGSWRLHNRKKNSAGIWEEFPATVTAEKALDGRALLEHFEAIFPTGELVKGLAVIAYDTAAEHWAHAWIETRVPPDFAPLYGKFSGGIGEFHGIEVGQHLRFLWDRIEKDSVRWRQATSTDGGSTWDTNWIMEYTRT